MYRARRETHEYLLTSRHRRRSLLRSKHLYTSRTARPALQRLQFRHHALWQFVSLAIGTAIAGDVNMKLMYALIGQRNSRKGMLMTAIGAAFGDLIDAGKSAKNPARNHFRQR